jgi:hypothetical protein
VSASPTLPTTDPWNSLGRPTGDGDYDAFTWIDGPSQKAMIAVSDSGGPYATKPLHDGPGGPPDGTLSTWGSAVAWGNDKLVAVWVGNSTPGTPPFDIRQAVYRISEDGGATWTPSDMWNEGLVAYDRKDIDLAFDPQSGYWLAASVLRGGNQAQVQVFEECTGPACPGPLDEIKLNLLTAAGTLRGATVDCKPFEEYNCVLAWADAGTFSHQNTIRSAHFKIDASGNYIGSPGGVVASGYVSTTAPVITYHPGVQDNYPWKLVYNVTLSNNYDLLVVLKKGVSYSATWQLASYFLVPGKPVGASIGGGVDPSTGEPELRLFHSYVPY